MSAKAKLRHKGYGRFPSSTPETGLAENHPIPVIWPSDKMGIKCRISATSTSLWRDSPFA
jgi:hypothetical protein